MGNIATALEKLQPIFDLEFFVGNIATDFRNVFLVKFHSNMIQLVDTLSTFDPLTPFSQFEILWADCRNTTISTKLTLIMCKIRFLVRSGHFRS